MPTLDELTSHGFDPYADVAGETGWFGSDIAKGIGKVAKGVAKGASKLGKLPIVQTAVGAARTALKNSGPWGMAANGVISAMDAGFSGKNVGEIALAAAQGAAPSGIDTALNAGVALARGDNVLTTAIKAGADAFAPGSGERFAYSVATDALKKGATKADLGIARRALANEGQRRAFDAAVGVLAIAAKKKTGGGGFAAKIRAAFPAAMPALPAPRAAASIMRTAPRPLIPSRPVVRGKPIMRALSSGRPTARPVMTISPRGNVPVPGRPVLTVKSHAIPKNRLVKWKRLSPRAARFILGRVPMANKLALVGRDTGALAGGLTAANMPTVRSGSSGSAVSTLQATLNSKRGSGLVVDGKFGPLTLSAVKTFQLSSALVADGIVGPKTWGALDAAAPLPVLVPTVFQAPVPSVSTGIVRPTLRSGARGSAVIELQTLLNMKHGSGLKVDGIFGNNTLSAVKSFQKSRGLVVDGVVGPKTWGALDVAPIKVLPSTSPAVVLPSIPSTPILNIPSIGESGTDTSAIIQAKTILVAWSKTDGIVEAGLPDYGTRPEDLSTTFGSRDKFVLASFCRWNNKTQGTSLNTDGDLTPPVADALRLWAEKKSSVVTPSVSVPTTSPGIVPVSTSLPTIPTNSTLPAVVSKPDGTIVVLPQDTVLAQPPTIPTNSTLPAVVSKPDGTIVVLPQDTVLAQPPAGTKKDDTLILAAGGAGLGYLMAGPVGALIGAAAGALPALLGGKSA